MAASTGWRGAVVLLVIATAMPVLMAVLFLMLVDGILRWIGLGLVVLGLVVILPFWPPVLRDDHETVNAMLDRRRNR